MYKLHIIVFTLIIMSLPLWAQNKIQTKDFLYAAQRGDLKKVKSLITKADINAQDSNGTTALMFAAFRGYKEIANLIIAAKANINTRDNYGMTALMLAAFRGHREIVDTLLAANANIHIKDQVGRTALTLATDQENKDIEEAIVARMVALLEKIYRHSSDGYATTIEPLHSATTYNNSLVTAVYDTLFEYKYLERPYMLKPNLAVAMPKVSKDGLVYTIKIKQGVFFTDDPAFIGGKGREVVAKDFIYSIKRHFDRRNRSQGSWLWRGRIVGLDTWGMTTDYNKEVAGLKAIDKYTIQITLVKPYPQILYTFAVGFAAIVPKEAVEKYGRKLSKYAVGSGPFKVLSFNMRKAILVRNKKYRRDIFDAKFEGYNKKIHDHTGIKALDGKKMPIVDAITIDFTPPMTRWNSFVEGKVQVCLVPLEQLEEVLSSKKPPTLRPRYSKKYFLKAERESAFVFSIFNMANTTFGNSQDPRQNAKNKALRKAMRKAFSWNKRIERFYLGIGEAFAGVIPPGTAGYSKLPKDSIVQDIKGAKKILKDAGWTADNLPVFEYPGVSSIRNRQFFEQIRGWLIAIGYPKEKIKYKTFANFVDLNKAMKMRKNVFNIYRWGLEYPDAENTMQLFYGPNAAPGSNTSNFDHPQYNKFFRQAASMPHSKERTAIYRRMNEILIEECVGIFGFSRTRLLVWHKNVIAYPTRDILGNIFKYVDIK